MCRDGAGESEFAIQKILGNFWHGLIPWGHIEFDLTNDSWGPVGFLNNDVKFPYAKMINSIFLINRALSEYNGGCRQWHSSVDYTDSCRGSSKNRFHGEYYYQFVQDWGGRPAHAEVRRFLAEDRTVCHCPLFDFGSSSDTPTFRAATLIHESWHHWQYKHRFDGTHPKRTDGKEGDYFYWHTAEAFTFGSMHSYDLNPSRFRFLSPYQVQAEFLDDLSIFHRRDTPISVALRAHTEANATLEQKFVNPPRYRVGDPKPFA
ncbi:hypothetical protein [Streptomyces violaceus]|uniref:Uncharacterized protein n=1 Tax=Streptomyces violaceus TaxID=1936 RepID=A0ABY9U1R9_STRVL|nr:hypothetical protein [Streptomyces janthinus]WND16226.1 hypothetical protein RI060_02155 [Streptomyces janthinus]GGS90074.1 hypothetical protein GCM10010270_72810 [Streptomyces janthinus]